MSNIFESMKNELAEIEERLNKAESKIEKYEYENTIVGYIYIAINKDYANSVKIGYSKDVDKRMKELYTSGVKSPFHWYAKYAVTHERTDTEVHNLIDSFDPDLRPNTSREFFDLDEKRAYTILESIAKISGTMDRLVLNPLNDEYFNNHKVVENREVIEKTIKESNITCSIVDDFKNRNSKIEEEIESINKKNSYEYICVPEGFYHNKNKTAYAFVDEIGTWTILKGSYANTKTYERSGVHSKLHNTRWEHIENNIFKEDVNLGIVKPSGSANYIENHAMDGWGYWYTDEDIIIDEAFPRNKRNRNINN